MKTQTITVCERTTHVRDKKVRLYRCSYGTPKEYHHSKLVQHTWFSADGKWCQKMSPCCAVCGESVEDHEVGSDGSLWRTKP